MTDYDDELVPVYPDVGAFFAGELRPVLERRQGAPRGVAWCPQWPEHPEAVARLTAVWEAWEALGAKSAPGWRSDWWLNHVDPHLEVLFEGEAGPFYRCADGHSPVALLPLPCQHPA